MLGFEGIGFCEVFFFFVQLICFCGFGYSSSQSRVFVICIHFFLHKLKIRVNQH